MPTVRRRTLFVAVAFAAVAIAACGGSNSPASTSPTPTVAPAADVVATPTAKPAARLLYAFDPAISESDRALVREISAAAREYFVAQTGRDLIRDVNYVVLPANARRPVGVFDGEAITIHAGNEGWSLTADDPQSRLTKAHVVAHELFHTLQAAMLGKRAIESTDSSPWVIEGTAEYASYSYLVSAGLTTWADVHRRADPFLSRRLAPAAGTGTRSGAAYPVAFLAIERLVADRGLRLVADFWVDCAGMDWRDAFKKNFGQDPLAYINGFEAGRPP